MVIVFGATGYHIEQQNRPPALIYIKKLDNGC